MTIALLKACVAEAWVVVVVESAPTPPYDAMSWRPQMAACLPSTGLHVAHPCVCVLSESLSLSELYCTRANHTWPSCAKSDIDPWILTLILLVMVMGSLAADDTTALLLL